MMHPVTVLIVLQALLIYRGSAISRSHTFVTNSNFENPDRWLDAEHGIPCGGDKIEFDQNSRMSIFVQSNFTITEIVLPLDGEFIFADGVNWGPDESLSSCHEDGHDDHVIRFNSQPDNWFDAANWQANLGSGDAMNPMDLLDVEKVPCEHDAALFPEQNSWITTLSYDFGLQSFSVWEKAYGTNELVSYRSSGGGYYQFQGDGQVAINPSQCPDVTGCACRTGSNTAEIQAQICNSFQCKSSQQCKDPIKAAGQCCPLCGATVTFQYETGYTENAMSSYLNTLLGKSEYRSCHFALSKIGLAMSGASSNVRAGVGTQGISARASSDYIQVMVTAEDNGKSAQKFANEVANYLKSASSGMGAVNVTVRASGDPTGSGLSSGQIAGIVIGVIAGILLITAGLVFYNKRVAYQQKFKLFQFKDDSTHVENPMYNMGYSQKPAVEAMEGESLDSSVTGMPSMSAMTSDFGITFGNPMYREEDV